MLAEFNADDRIYPAAYEYAAVRPAERYCFAESALLSRFADRTFRKRPDGSFQRKCDPAKGSGSNSRVNRRQKLWRVFQELLYRVLVARKGISGPCANRCEPDDCTSASRASRRGPLGTIRTAACSSKQRASLKCATIAPLLPVPFTARTRSRSYTWHGRDQHNELELHRP
jgi:hypothetical protein